MGTVETKQTSATPTGWGHDWQARWWIPVNVVFGAIALLALLLTTLVRARMVDAGEAADVANLLGMLTRSVLAALLIFNVAMVLIWAIGRRSLAADCD